MNQTPNIETVRSTMLAHKICIVIPTYNNDPTLANVITEILHFTDQIIVVNDGSTDRTADILSSFSIRINIVTLPRNKGKGSALKAGFRRAKELGFRHAITIDSDGQHYPADIPAFVKAIVENPDAIIIGQRDLNKVDISGKSSFANKFSNFWFNLQTGCRLKDTQTGYRAYPLDRLRWLPLLTNRYEAELELMVYASWHGTEIISIPIRIHYPPQSERVSHFRPGIDFTRISILNTILCAAAIFYGIPARVVNSIRHKRLFKSGFKQFTHKKGSPKEAATTISRLTRSIYGFCYFAFWAVGVFTPLGWIYFNIGKNTENKRLCFHRALQCICRHLIKRYPGSKVSYNNPYRETFRQPAIIVCNHQSHLDLPVIMSLSPKLIFLTNDWAWNNVLYSQIIHNAEFLPTSAGVDVLLPKIKDLKDRGYSIVIFPEGTRSADCSILRFHQGAFRVAQMLKMDIIPLTLHGAGHYLPKKDLMFRKNPITLSVGERHCFSAEDLETTSLKLASKYRKIIRTEYDRIAGLEETAAYFKALVLYKYAYRGWNVTSHAKKLLRQLHDIARFTDRVDKSVRYIRIINGGIGVVPLLFALVNPSVEVYAYEENLRNFNIATSTPHLPANLHFVHPVWDDDYTSSGITFDTTYIINTANGHDADRFKFFNPILIELKQ